MGCGCSTISSQGLPNELKNELELPLSTSTELSTFNNTESTITILEFNQNPRFKSMETQNMTIFNIGKNILDDVLGVDRKKVFEWKKCTNEDGLNLKMFVDPSKSIRDFVLRVSRILTENGFQIDSNNYHIDFHRYNLSGKKYSSELDWHEDDYGATNYPVSTVILYLRKDITLKGGNLLIRDGNFLFPNIYQIPIFENKMVLIDGRITHKPEDLDGKGCRDSIVVQFKRL